MNKSNLSGHTIAQIIIAGCGHIGRKVLTEIISRKTLSAKKIITLVNTKQSQEFCLQQEVESISIDLDAPAFIMKDIVKNTDTLVYYFIAPPRKGIIDSRAKQFIEQLKQNQSYSPVKIVLISTTGVYGNCQGKWVDEEYPLNPQVDRARRRVDAEQQFQSYCQRFNVPLVILRVSGIYSSEKLPLKRIRSNTPIVCQTDSPYSNRIHSKDLVEICIEAGINNKITGIFNCADGHPTTMYDYFTKVAQANHLPEPITISLHKARSQLSAGMLSYMDESRRINNKKLLENFNLKLQYPYLKLENLKADY